MSSALDLVVLNGPDEGEVVPLKTNQPLSLGRSAKGLQLIDPLVSLNHAEITWEGDRYWIEDLGSATGTYVNDVRLAEKAVVLVPGMRIRLGETDLEVRERPRSAMLRIVGAFAALFILFLSVRSFMDSIEVKYDPAIRWYEPIQQGGGYASEILRIPIDFIRETGVDHRELAIEEISDYDGDGVDELWLRWPGGRRLVTFAPDGTWTTLADLSLDCRIKGRPLREGLPAECYIDKSRVATEVPDACAAVAGTNGYPDLDCAGSIYRFQGTQYEIVEHEGVYAWMPPTKEIERKVKDKKEKVKVAIDGPPNPFLFTLTRRSHLAGFLADRGIVEPIHYLICEEALPGARAQVMTQTGEIVPLAVGCIGDIQIDGPTRRSDFGDGIPMMFAFTGTGYRELLEDVAIYLSGSTDKLFMDRRQRALYDRIAAPPIRRKGAIRLRFEGPERIFDPVASEGGIERDEPLVASEFTTPPPPLARTVVIDGPGRYALEGCSELDVDMSGWHCLFTKGCGANSTFMTIRNVGCGPGNPVSYPFARGVHGYGDGVIDGRIAIESIDQDGQIDVLRARFSYRERPAP